MTKFKKMFKSIFHKDRPLDPIPQSIIPHDENRNDSPWSPVIAQADANHSPVEVSTSIIPTRQNVRAQGAEATEFPEVEFGEPSEVINDIATTRNKLNDASDVKFQYGAPLKESQIRLVQIQPGCGEEPIICSLILSPLEGGPHPFEAVSYVWGSEENPHPITCNWTVPFVGREGFSYACPAKITKNMTVTDNLYCLLLRLRKPKSMPTLWIDQICIDQDKNSSKQQEKMSQVRMMAEVYGAATNVIIWLGEENSDTATAYRMMRWMAETSHMSEIELGRFMDYSQTDDNILSFDTETPEQRQSILNKREYSRSLLAFAQPAVVDGLEDADWEDPPSSPRAMYITFLGSQPFGALIQRPWFGRSWTFQESISARDATVLCGSHAVKWNTLYEACKACQERRDVRWQGRGDI